MDKSNSISGTPESPVANSTIAELLREFASDLESHDNSPEFTSRARIEIENLKRRLLWNQSPSEPRYSPTRTLHLLPRTRASTNKRSLTSSYKASNSSKSTSTLLSRPVTHHGLSEAHQAVSRWFDAFPPAASRGFVVSGNPEELRPDDLMLKRSAIDNPSPTDESAIRESPPMQDLRIRLAHVVAQLQQRQEESKYIADLAAHQAMVNNFEMQKLKMENSNLRKDLEILSSGFRVLAFRLESLEERLSTLEKDPDDQIEKKEALERLHRSVSDWRKNCKSIGRGYFTKEAHETTKIDISTKTETSSSITAMSTTSINEEMPDHDQNDNYIMSQNG